MNFGYMLNNFALSVRADGTYTPFSADAWSYAAQMTILGVGMVFSVLVALMVVLEIFKLIFAGRTPKEEAPKKSPKPVKAAEKEKTSVPVEDDTLTAVIAASIQAYRADSDEALVAVITAAVAAYRAAEGQDSTGFRVVSFKRVNGRAWNSKR